jgi:predicted cation transporter
VDVPNVFQIEGWVLLIVMLVLLGVKIFAFISSLMYSAESYEAANKLTKPAWCAILGVGMAAALVFVGSPLGLINLAFTIAAFVYLADVRPALASLTRR